MPGGTVRSVGFAAAASAKASNDSPSKAADPLPSSQARRAELVARIRRVRDEAAAEAHEFLVHGRICVGGQVLLQVIRAISKIRGSITGHEGMHLVSTISDSACCVCAAPLFVCGTGGQLVQHGCLGPLLTLVFAMAVVDFGVFVAYLATAPWPLSTNTRCFTDVLEASVGVWEFSLVASLALQVSLSLSTWRVYRCLRRVGLYPPGRDLELAGRIQHVSVLEVICEAEDLEHIPNCMMACLGRDGAIEQTDGDRSSDAATSE